MTQVITGMFDSFAVASKAVTQLKAEGIKSDDLSIIANNADDAYKLADDTLVEVESGAGTGAAIGGVGELLAGLGLMVIPGVGPVVAAGWVATTLAGAAVGAIAGAAVGGLVSAFTKAGVTDSEAEVLAEHVRRGGAVICVRTDKDHADNVLSILQRNASIDVAARRSSFESDGWEGFDANARPLNSREVQAERARLSHR